jgi:type I restriction enzyme S subunit
MIGQGKTRGQTAILDIDAATNQNVAAIRLLGILPKMIWYFFLSRYEVTRSGASGGNQPALNGIKIRNTVLALPPLAEQKAIVAKVESLLALCDQLEQQVTAAQTHAEQLMQAVLKEAFQQNGRSVGECAAD